MPRPRILLIDVSPTVQAALALGLEDAGFKVLIASDASEALDILDEAQQG